MSILEAAPDGSPQDAESMEAAQALSVLLAETPATTPECLVSQIEWLAEDYYDCVRCNALPAHDLIFATLAKGVGNIKQ